MIFDCFFLPVRVEDEGDEEGDVEGGHTHPGAVILCKKTDALYWMIRMVKQTSMMGRV